MTPDDTPRKKVKTPWTPWQSAASGSIETPRAEQLPVMLGGAPVKSDPSLERVIASMLKLGASKYHVARLQRFTTKHLTPKAKARARAARRARAYARRQNLTNRGKAQ